MATGGGKFNKVCWYFNNGRCLFGESCRNEHVFVDPLEINPRCKFYRTPSGCRNGNRCSYRHDNVDSTLTSLESSVKKEGSDEHDTTDSDSGVPDLIDDNLQQDHSSANTATNDQAGIKEEDKSTGELDEELEHASDVDSDDVAAMRKRILGLSCGECGKEFPETPSNFEELCDHYVEKLLTRDPEHIEYFEGDPDFKQHRFLCSYCERRFPKLVSYLQHMKSKIESGKEMEKDVHKTIMESYGDLFTERDMGIYDEEYTLEHLKITMLDNYVGKGSDSDSDSDDCVLRVSSYQMYQMTRAGEWSEDEIDERMNNLGFTEDEVQELLCQGVKPWDDDAWDVLDVLYDGWQF